MSGRPLALLAAGALAAGVGLLTVEDAPAGRAPPPAQDGAAVFRAKGCASCHTGPDSRGDLGVAPALDDLAVSADDRIARRSLEDDVRQSVLDPQADLVRGATSTQMPVLPVTPEELDALVAYLLGPST